MSTSKFKSFGTDGADSSKMAGFKAAPVDASDSDKLSKDIAAFLHQEVPAEKEEEIKKEAEAAQQEGRKTDVRCPICGLGPDQCEWIAARIGGRL